MLSNKLDNTINKWKEVLNFHLGGLTEEKLPVFKKVEI